MTPYVLGIVPARGGSKGIVGKNLAPLDGRPLIAYTADAVRGSRRLSRTIVTTDDEAVAAAAASAGLDVPFRRPAHLAGDAVAMLPVLQHAVETLRGDGVDPDVVVLLQPTSPLRRGDHIDAAIALLESSRADSVVSVMEVPHRFSPVSVLTMVGDRLFPLFDGPAVSRRQDKPRVYARNGPAVLAIRTDVLMAGSLYGEDCRALLMAEEDSLDVDTAFDLRLAELLLRERRVSVQQP
jgi:CMP-N-acetylneuraminic acid synthetase